MRTVKESAAKPSKAPISGANEPAVTRCDDRTRVADLPDSGGDVGHGTNTNPNKPAVAKCHVTRRHRAVLDGQAPAQREERQQRKLLSRTSVSPMHAPFRCAPKATGPHGHQAGGETCFASSPCRRQPSADRRMNQSAEPTKSTPKAIIAIHALGTCQ